MMGEIILQFLTWAVPSGGIGAAIVWLTDRHKRDAETTKVVHDTYKEMYDDVSTLLIATQKRNTEINAKLEDLETESRRMRSALNRLSRAIEAIQLCPYRSECPVRAELRIDSDLDELGNENVERQRDGDDGGMAQRGSRASVGDQPVDTHRQSSISADGSGIRKKKRSGNRKGKARTGSQPAAS